MLTLLIFGLALVQQPKPLTGSATTDGACSLANTGTIGTVTLTCGIGQEQGKQILSILNKMLGNQVPMDAVISRLDDAIRELKARTPQIDVQENRRRRAQIAMFMDEASVLRQDCLAQQLSIDALQTKAIDWANRVSEYLKSVDPLWASSFNTVTGLTYLHSIPPAYENVWNYVNLRWNALKGISDRLPPS